MKLSKLLSNSPGLTSWIVPDALCPNCGALVASDGRTKWCMGNDCAWEVEA